MTIQDDEFFCVLEFILTKENNGVGKEVEVQIKQITQINTCKFMLMVIIYT